MALILKSDPCSSPPKLKNAFMVVGSFPIFIVVFSIGSMTGSTGVGVLSCNAEIAKTNNLEA